MIFNHDKIYMKVWKITPHEKYLDLQGSTSEKLDSGEFINSSWFPRVIGHAFNSLKDTLKEGDRIIITKSKFSNERYTAKDGTAKSAFKFLILEAQLEKGAKTAPESISNTADEPEDEGNELPW